MDVVEGAGDHHLEREVASAGEAMIEEEATTAVEDTVDTLRRRGEVAIVEDTEDVQEVMRRTEKARFEALS